MDPTGVRWAFDHTGEDTETETKGRTPFKAGSRELRVTYVQAKEMPRVTGSTRNERKE